MKITGEFIFSDDCLRRDRGLLCERSGRRPRPEKVFEDMK